MDGNNPNIYGGAGDGYIIIWIFNLGPKWFFGKIKNHSQWPNRASDKKV